MVVIHGEVVGQGGAGATLAVLAGGLAPTEDVALAAKRLKALTPLFTKSKPPGALLTPLTWAAVVQLAATYGPDWHPGPALQAWMREQVLARTSVGAHLAYRPPAGLTPYPWQVEGAAMIAATGRALITDEPGTGKTITTILGLAELAQRHGLGEPLGAFGGPVLVVCPASVVDSWVAAWEAWAPHVRVVAWRGPTKKRTAMAGTADVYVTSYDLARMDAPPVRPCAPLVELEIGALVIDECHLIKNHRTARSQALRRLAGGVVKRQGAVVALSGTPITHHPGDLWATLHALEPDAWPSRERWVARYCETVQEEYREEILGLNRAAEAEFRDTLLGQLRRVAKADVLDQLPPKVYSVRTVELPATKGNDWRKAYDDFEAQMLAELPSTGPDGEAVQELSVMSVMAVMGHLAQLASAPADVEVTYGPDVDEQTGEPKRHVHLELKGPSWKVDALLELLEERRTDGSTSSAPRCAPVVAFAPSRQLVVLAGEAAAAQGYRVGYIVGGQSPAERTRAVEAFQAGELDLICVTTGAGGVGITLTAARTVVFLQRPWSLVEAMQAEDRCHRIGSERHDSIEVIDIVARATIDSRVRSVLRGRAGQLADLVQDPRIVAELLGGTAGSDASRLRPSASSLPNPLERRAS